MTAERLGALTFDLLLYGGIAFIVVKFLLREYKKWKENDPNKKNES